MGAAGGGEGGGPQLGINAFLCPVGAAPAAV